MDITPRIREAKFHCLLFLNIPRYAGGTQPWGRSSSASGPSEEPETTTATPRRAGKGEFGPPAIDDGLIEILGFTSATLAAIQVGGSGERLAQCRSVKMVTWKPIPSQVPFLSPASWQ